MSVFVKVTFPMVCVHVRLLELLGRCVLLCRT